MTPHASNNRILLIDDNPAIHEDYRKILTGEEDHELNAARADLFGCAAPAPRTKQFVTDSAFQGEDGLRLVEEACKAGTPYAMAFVDMRMPPGWDGVETIRRIWEVCPICEWSSPPPTRTTRWTR